MNGYIAIFVLLVLPLMAVIVFLPRKGECLKQVTYEVGDSTLGATVQQCVERDAIPSLWNKVFE